MTRDDIIRMARSCGLVDVSERDDFDIWVRGQIEVIDIEAFAAIVAAAERNACLEMVGILVEAEREACAKVCEDGINSEQYPTLTEIAAAIRARGQA